MAVTILCRMVYRRGQAGRLFRGVIEFDAVQFVLRKHKFPVKPADSQRFLFFFFSGCSNENRFVKVPEAENPLMKISVQWGS